MQEGGAEVGRIVERYIRETLGDPKRLREKLEQLTGERGKDGAAKKAQLEALTTLPAEPKSREAAGAAPTKDEHDALVADVHAIFAAVNAMRVLL
jgi:hypothetical protein